MSPWLDPANPVDERVAALLDQLTTEQKLGQLGSDATGAAIPSLGIPSFNWQHGKPPQLPARLCRSPGAGGDGGARCPAAAV